MKIFKTLLHTIIEGRDVTIEISHKFLTEAEYKKLNFKFKISSKFPLFKREEHDMIIEKDSFEKFYV